MFSYIGGVKELILKLILVAIFLCLGITSIKSRAKGNKLEAIQDQLTMIIIAIILS